MSKTNEVTVGHEGNVTNAIGNIVANGSEVATTTAKSELDKTTVTTPRARLIRNFTYELNDVENVFTSKISFFLTELNKQLNALVNSNIYTENKEKLDKVLKSKGEFRKEFLYLLKTEYKDFYHTYYFNTEIFGNKAKYFRTVIEEYRRILLSRLSRQTIIDMIVKNPTITYQEVFNKLCELNERSSDKDYKFNWISKAEFNNIIKQLKNLSKSPNSTSEAVEAELRQTTTIDYVDNVSDGFSTDINVYAIDYSSEDDQISEFNLTESEDKEYYIVEFKLKYSDYTTQSDSLLTYQCKVPKKQIKGLTTGYTKLEKFTRPRIFLRNPKGGVTSGGDFSLDSPPHKLYISFNYELSNECKNSKLAIESVNTWQFKTMGIDIGVAKSATAAIVTTNMCLQSVAAEVSNGKQSNVEAKQVEPERAKLVAIDFTKPVAISNELTISDKTKSVSEHIEKLKEEQNHIYKKEKAIYDLLKLKQFDSFANDGSANADELVNHTGGEAAASPAKLLHKYQRLNKHRLHLRHKVSNLKKELSFLTARDMISHAIDNNVDLITLEKLSWISDADEHHTTWDYSQIQQRIIHEANIYGIKVKKVSCAYSSAHNPLTLEKDEVDQNRKLVKCLFDRDYASAIILARRGVKLGKKKLCSFAASPSQQQSCKEQSSTSASHINDSFKAVSCSIKPSLQPSLPTLQYRQLKLCEKKSIISKAIVLNESNFAYYNIL